MKPKNQLTQAINYFKHSFEYCEPVKYRSTCGFDYLIVQNKKQATGSIHINTYFDYLDFSYYKGTQGKLSTSQKLNVGSLIFFNDLIYSVKTQLSFNEAFNLYHYELIAYETYYKDFIITKEALKNEILSTDSSRFLLSLNYKIALIPAKMEPNNSINKFISFEILETKAYSIASIEYINKKPYVTQAKSDIVRFYGVNLTTQEAQDFINFITTQQDFGYAGFPTWQAYQDNFIKDFKIKANIKVLDVIINYNIITETETQEHIINSVEFNLINLLKGV